MSESHTPGPWSYDGPRSNIHVRELHRPHMRICFMTSDGPTEANARLIAVAPKMLAVLKEIDATWPVATSELRERVRKVIAAADANGQSGDTK